MTSLPTPAPLRGLVDTLGFRLGLVLVAVVAAYHYSLSTLLSTLSVETPLAYLGLVPVIALGLALLRARPTKAEPDIHDRQVDLIVGVPLVAVALAMTLLLPDRLSTLYWVYRIDVLSLPLFVAGAVTLVFGVRTAWRLRFPIGFLLLAWPVPYNILVDRGLDQSTQVTLAGLKAALGVIPLAAVNIAGSDGSLFSIGQGAEAFTVSVAAACAGVNSMVGFLLVGVAFTSVVRGTRVRKAAWLLVGITLIWLLNLGRLLLIFWAGAAFGEGVAIDGLHPFIGLVLFCLGVLAMVLLLPVFGISLDLPPARIRRAGDTTLARWRRSMGTRVSGARGFRTAGVVVIASALVLTAANSSLDRYGLVADRLGAARLVAFETSPAVVDGFSSAKIARYEWATRFFGGDSSWDRYLYNGYSATAASTGAVAASGTPIVVDVVSTGKLRSFSDYGIEACYAFHGYDVKRNESLDLGGGVRGSLLTYRDPEQPVDWNALYWVWPVSDGEGGQRFERVVLLQSTDASATLRTPSQQLEKTGSVVTGGAPSLAAGAEASRKALTSFAVELVQDREAGPSEPVTAQGRPGS